MDDLFPDVILQGDQNVAGLEICVDQITTLVQDWFVEDGCVSML